MNKCLGMSAKLMSNAYKFPQGAVSDTSRSIRRFGVVWNNSVRTPGQ
jgi:hypothetical protein